jgi:hypothetical protein
MPRGINALDEARLQGRLWTPELLRSDMAFWWDTSRDDSITLSGSTLTQLRDLSGNGITLNTSGAAPGWDAVNKVATFNGTSQSLITTATVGFAANGDFTLITLLNPSASQLTINTPLDIDHSGSPNGPLVLQNETARPSANNCYFAWYTGSGFTNTGAPFVVMPSGSWSLAVMTKTGAVADAFINGTRGASWPSTQNSGLTATAKTVRIGNAVSTATRWWAGSFGGAILLRRSLSESEIQKVTASLLWQRGLQSQLPASHPFRNRPPLIGD